MQREYSLDGIDVIGRPDEFDIETYLWRVRCQRNRADVTRIIHGGRAHDSMWGGYAIGTGGNR